MLVAKQKLQKKNTGQGVRLTSQTKQIVENVRQFFEKERRTGKSIKRMQVLERTAEATGISVRSVWSEFIDCEGKFFTPVKRYAMSRVRVNPDSFDREVIRRAVHAFYEKKEYPTLSCILMKVKEDSAFPGGRFCLWRILKEMGFTYKKRQQTICLRRTTQHTRTKTYLQTVLQLRKQKKTTCLHRRNMG